MLFLIIQELVFPLSLVMLFIVESCGDCGELY